MDAFWVIPLSIVVIAFVWGLCLHLLRQPESPSKPHVLVDKPPDRKPEDSIEKQRDRTERPCGSYLDWLFGRRQK